MPGPPPFPLVTLSAHVPAFSECKSFWGAAGSETAESVPLALWLPCSPSVRLLTFLDSVGIVSPVSQQPLLLQSRLTQDAPPLHPDK